MYGEYVAPRAHGLPSFTEAVVLAEYPSIAAVTAAMSWNREKKQLAAAIRSGAPFAAEVSCGSENA